MVRTIDGPHITLPRTANRIEIVKFLGSTFLDTEYGIDHRGINFRYQVEMLRNKPIFILRPGKKWGFDFKVLVRRKWGFGRGTQKKIASVLRNLRKQDPKKSASIWKILDELYHCSTNNADSLLKRWPISRDGDPDAEALIKTLKWMFIMEDMMYWFYEGRAFLYNACRFVAYVEGDDAAKMVLDKMADLSIKPRHVRSAILRNRMQWVAP